MTPKLHFLDSCLRATLRGLSFDRVMADRGAFGTRLESVVFAAILKLMTASDLWQAPHHFLDRNGRDFDMALERDDAMAGESGVSNSRRAQWSNPVISATARPWPTRAENRVFYSYDAIIEALCEVWNKLVAPHDTIKSIGVRKWAHVGRCK